MPDNPDHTPDYQRRVVNEHDELEQKLAALDSFFETGSYAALPYTHRRLLRQQFAVMTQYAVVLEDRLHLWGLAQ